MTAAVPTSRRSGLDGVERAASLFRPLLLFWSTLRPQTSLQNRDLLVIVVPHRAGHQADFVSEAAARRPIP